LGTSVGCFDQFDVYLEFASGSTVSHPAPNPARRCSDLPAKEAFYVHAVRHIWCQMRAALEVGASCSRWVF